MPGKIPLLVKVGIAPAVAGLIVLIILAWQVYITSGIERDAAAINLAGSQRMRLFKLVLLTEQYLEHGEPKIRALIDQEMTTFEAILHGLKHGDPRYTLKSTDDLELIAYLDKRVDEWNKTIKPLFQNVLAASASRETLRTLKDHVEEYVTRIDTLAALLQADSEKKVAALYHLLWVFLLANIVIGLGSLIYIHLIILKPIKIFAETSRAIAAGDLSRAVPVLSKDEIGELASDFNEMSARLKNHIETLRQKTVELEAQKALIETDRRAILGLKKYAEDIIASLPAGLIVVDDALKVLSVNRSFRELFGRRNEEDFSGRDLEDILPLPGLRQQVQAVLESGTAVRGIAAVLGKKQLRLALAGIRLAEEEEEEEARLLVVVEDVAEEERLRAEAHAHEQRFHDLVQGLDAIVWEADAATLAFTFVSRRAEAILGYPVERWLAEPGFWVGLIHPEDREQTLALYREATAQGRDHAFEYRAVAADGRVVWLRDVVHVVCEQGRVERLRGVMVDLTARKRAEEWQRHYARTLDLLSTGAPLSEVLEGIAAFAERQSKGALCSILLLSHDGKHLVHGAAPSLPEFYNRAIDGLEIGEGVGSCGTAAASGRTVIVEDVLTHPYWTNYRDLAARAGLRACWSEPIVSGDNKVLGTFALYYREPRTPTPEEIEPIRQAARLAAIVIERTRQQEDLKLAAVVFEQSVEAIMVTDAAERILIVNRAFVALTGYAPEEATGQTPRLLNSGRHDAVFFRALREALARDGRWQGEIWNRRKSGEIHPVWMSIATVRDAQGAVSHHISILVDISEQKAQAARIEQLAFYDPLTGLPNRALFMDRLKQTLAAAQRHGQRVALLFLDLNRFKEINDTQGHAIGDHALAEVARRFQAALRQEETLARLAGDEFVVIAVGADQAAAALIAERLQQALAEPLVVKGHVFALSASIGIAFYPEDGSSPEDLLKHTDIAMYRAKVSGGGYRFYRPEMGTELEKRLEVARRLGRALEAQQLQLYYQPQVHLQTGKVPGAEALLRWFDPEWGPVPPAEFIPIAEERGMMGALGEWVLREACRQVKAWQEAGLSLPGRLAVNVAAQQLEEAEFVTKVPNIVRAAGLTPSLFELELTESSMMADPERAIGVMEALKTAGFALSIDDFGTGYSSLAYLKRFAADKLKIDISFVRDMLSDRNDYAIVATIIAMARTLKLKTVAEGVEKAAQAEALRALGCDGAQGYYFGHPEPPDAFAQKWLRPAGGGHGV
ncbi:MAG: EAL domain-containing protein [Burkholderiales bacterium]|nr:EAL domain-containing protein [Burkholderiales bacterium]